MGFNASEVLSPEFATEGHPGIKVSADENLRRRAKLYIFGIVIVNYLPCTLSLDPFEPFSYGQTVGRQTVTLRLSPDTVAAVDSARRVSTVTFPVRTTVMFDN